MLKYVVSRFSEAGLPLRLLGGPIRNADRRIFQMDILRNGEVEYFRLWPGSPDLKLDALGIDRSLRQLVLAVREPELKFERRLSKRMLDREQAAQAGRLIRENTTSWFVEARTPGEDRRYLVGFDETHLFMARVSRGESVAEAHEALKPAEVAAAERARPGSVLRQGEWFFLVPSPQELAELVRLHPADPALEREAPLWPGARPHVAQERAALRVILRVADRDRIVTGLFARGVVSHVDHAPLRLDGWRRVVRNAEIQEDPRTGSVRWID